MNSEPVIEVEDLSFSYNGLLVLEEVGFEISAHDFVSVVGPNGGGKTTLLKLILGLLRPSRGLVRVFGRTPKESRSRVGYLPQHSHLDPQFPVNVMDVALMGRVGPSRTYGPHGKIDRAVAEETLRELGIWDLRGRAFSDLSGGQRQRALIARALAGEPALLLLDEPTASLDVFTEADLYELLLRLTKRLTVLVVSHDLGFVSRYVNRVVCVKRNVVVHPTSEITGENINEVYGSPMKMVRHDHGPDGVC